MGTQKSTNNLFGEMIYSYSRAEALADGVLVDVSVMAREAGIRVNVALTLAVWEKCVVWTELDNTRQCRQDQSGRLWDVLCMCARAGRRVNSDRVTFTVMSIPRDGTSRRPGLVTLRMTIGPGDQGEPVITILEPGES